MKKVLIIGQYKDIAMYHPFDVVDQALSSMLSDYDVTTTDKIEDLLDISEYDCVISYWDDWNNKIPRECADALKSYVKNGGSILAIHNGISFDLWDDLKEMLGGFFITHPAQEDITFAPVPNPLTEGVSDFSLVEEPYQFEMVDDGKELILNYIYREMSYPAGWTKTYGKGKVAYLTPGHTSEKFENPSYIRLIQNCVDWCVI